MQEEYNKTYAKVMRNGKLVNILTSEIVKGDTILVQAGDKVPVDGILFEGHIKVSQAALNGEPEMRIRQQLILWMMQNLRLRFRKQSIYGICCNFR